MATQVSERFKVRTRLDTGDGCTEFAVPDIGNPIARLYPAVLDVGIDDRVGIAVFRRDREGRLLPPGASCVAMISTDDARLFADEMLRVAGVKVSA